MVRAFYSLFHPTTINSLWCVLLEADNYYTDILLDCIACCHIKSLLCKIQIDAHAITEEVSNFGLGWQ